MADTSFDIVVVGGGPGGYVAAIRAGQLGIPTVLIEGESLGGTCLNVGCIPSKAIIHAATAFEEATHWAGDSKIGIKVSSPSIDLAKTMKWKDGIVGRLTGGVGALLKKNGVQVIKGWATLVDGMKRAMACPTRIDADAYAAWDSRQPRPLGRAVDLLAARQ